MSVARFGLAWLVLDACDTPKAGGWALEELPPCLQLRLASSAANHPPTPPSETFCSL